MLAPVPLHGLPQLTFRERLRDIEACLGADSEKLYHLGLLGGVARNTLAVANEERDWRIYAKFAQKVIAQGRRLYTDDSLEVDLDQPSTPWTPRRSTSAFPSSLGPGRP